MTSTPALTTGRLALEPFSAGRISQTYVGWLNDPAVMRYSENRHRSQTVETCTAYVRSFDGGPNHLWAITESAGGRHIGNISANVDEANQVAEIGILIGEREVWGRGFGREAWAAVQGFLLRAGGVRKVEAGTMAENRAMLRIFEACGMDEEGQRARHFLLEGREIDLVHYAIFAEHGS
jgi:RimJ/RimL family protein N-acetyltransferase